MFYIRVVVEPGQRFGEIMSRYGLDSVKQNSVMGHKHNAHLRVNRTLLTPANSTVRRTHIIVPINIRLSIPEYRPVIDLVNGLRPHSVGATGPAILTHGLSIRITRNLGRGIGLNWIQTVRKLNNPDKDAPVEFVDAGHNRRPFYIQPPTGQAAPAETSDVPCGPIATAPNTGIDFTATTTLAVLVGDRIILAAGKTWGYEIGAKMTLPLGVREKPRRDATTADFDNQLHILRKGVNQFGDPTGRGLNYLLPPSPGSIIS